MSQTLHTTSSIYKACLNSMNTNKSISNQMITLLSWDVEMNIQLMQEDWKKAKKKRSEEKDGESVNETCVLDQRIRHLSLELVRSTI